MSARCAVALGIAAMISVARAPAQSAGEWRGPQHLWDALCGYCHGAGVSLQLLGAKLPAPLIAEVTRSGLKAMPPFAPTQISDAELAALAEWISHSEPPPRPATGASGGDR
jgi:mono/diheme cytochrome c family protein